MGGKRGIRLVNVLVSVVNFRVEKLILYFLHLHIYHGFAISFSPCVCHSFPRHMMLSLFRYMTHGDSCVVLLACPVCHSHGGLFSNLFCHPVGWREPEFLIRNCF